MHRIFAAVAFALVATGPTAPALGQTGDFPSRTIRIGILEKGRAQVLEGLAAGDEVRLK